METKTRINATIGESNEALLSAVDARRYKLFKVIDWGKIEADLTDKSSSDSSDNETEN